MKSLNINYSNIPSKGPKQNSKKEPTGRKNHSPKLSNDIKQRSNNKRRWEIPQGMHYKDRNSIRLSS